MISEKQKYYRYAEYRKLIDELLLENKTTGSNQSDEMVHYARLNQQRMQRHEKNLELSAELKTAIASIKNDIVLLAISEGWCGDAAQNLPLFSFIERESDKIELRILLRDENLDIMDQYLTNGSRSIPKIICLDKHSLAELFVWGPRPQPCQQIMEQMKKENADQKRKAEAIHSWYARDKSATLQKELAALLNQIARK